MNISKAWRPSQNISKAESVKRPPPANISMGMAAPNHPEAEHSKKQSTVPLPLRNITHTHTPTSPRIEAALGGGDLSDSVCEGVACEGEPVPETWGAHRCPIHQRTDPPTPSGSPELASDSSSAPCSSLERRYLIDRGHPQFPLPCDHVVARV